MKIITGMHRSGTSLVARFFYELGEDMGNPESFYVGDRWNPDGYFEQREVVAVNKGLVHGPWWKFSYFRLPSEGTILKRADQYRTKLKNLTERYRNKTVKDPRFCLTLPAWVRHGAPVGKVLVCVREPLDVAQSLRRRDRASIRRGLHLWYLHNLRLYRYIEQRSCCIILYENLLREETSLLEIRRALDFFEHELEDQQLRVLRDKCVRRPTRSGQDPVIAYPSELSVLWRKMLALRTPVGIPISSGRN